MPSAPTRKACCNETLAIGSVAHIQRCDDCGTISLHIGATTIRLDATACESLWATLSEALILLSDAEGDGIAPLRAVSPEARRPV